MSSPPESFPFNSSMTETDPATIDAQIAATVDLENGYLRFGNFIANLPGGLYVKIVEENDWFGQPYLKDDESDNFAHPLQFSDRARTVTWREFFDDIEHATVKSGIDRENLDQLSAAYLQPGLDRDPNRQAYILGAMPVYRHMRIAGYSHLDLTR